MYSPTSNERMVAMMEVLGPNVAMPIAQFIESIEALGDEDTKEVRVSSVQRDPGLEMEEELLRTRAIVRDLEERKASLAEELERTQSELAELRQDTAGISLRRRADSAESKDNILKQLRNASHVDKEHIADLEAEVAASRTTSEEQERMIDRFRAESQSRQDLRDQLQVMKAERDELVHTARANENLRKKIQSLQEASKAAETLGQDLENARRDIQSLREQCAALQQSNEERQKTIENGEQALSDQRTARKRVDYELKLLAQKLEDVTEQRSTDRDTIQEQKDRIRDLESASHNIVSDNLHQELVQDTRVKKLAASMDATRRENEQLVLQLRDSQRSLEGHKGLLRNTLSESSHEEDASSGTLKQSDEYKLIAGQLDTLRRSPDKIDDIARLIVARIHARGQESDGKKEEIIEVCCPHTSASTRHSRTTDYALALELQLTWTDVSPAKQKASSEDHTPRRSTSTGARSRQKTTSSTQSAPKHTDPQLEKLTQTHQSPAEEHLQRELSLMSSAWYSLTSRLQSDAVAVQRRSEAPKSFLNRERKLINNPALMKYSPCRRPTPR